jgi:hypothetical protein
MTQHQLDAQVASVTGESRQTIGRLGFTIADPLTPRFDPEGKVSGETEDPLAPYADWDQIQTSRRVALL